MLNIVSNPLNRSIPLIACMFLLAATFALSRDQRARLLPRLQPGQILTYLVRYRADKNVKTESSLAVPLAPGASQMDTHGLLRIEILELQHASEKPAIRARSQFLNDRVGASARKPASETAKAPPRPLSPDGHPVEFTISPGGLAEKITGLDELTSEQQQVWQEWLARFAMAWAIPSPRVKIGDKWKMEEAERATSPIAAALSVTGEVTPSNGTTDTCAVLLTTAKLVQKSPSKDATPEDFKLHELKTMGTAKGSNEIITYISLATGLVVRSTEEANQQMDVVVAKTDGSNGVHYNVDAKSQLEVLLLR